MIPRHRSRSVDDDGGGTRRRRVQSAAPVQSGIPGIPLQQNPNVVAGLQQQVNDLSQMMQNLMVVQQGFQQSMAGQIQQLILNQGQIGQEGLTACAGIVTPPAGPRGGFPPGIEVSGGSAAGIPFGIPPTSPDLGNGSQGQGFFGGQVFPEVPALPAGSETSKKSMDVDDKYLSRADKWISPIEKPRKWSNRFDEVVGFQNYITYLQSWLGNLSDRYPKEIFQALQHPTEIFQSSLSPGEATRSARLQSLLIQMFADIPKALNILLAYSETRGAMATCGYESLRLLSQEYSLYSRAEGWGFRQRILGKVFKEATVAETFTVFDLEMARYSRLIGSLKRPIDVQALEISDADRIILIMKSLPEKCREYVLSGDTDVFSTVRLRALEWEHKHRIWTELDVKTAQVKALVDDKGKGKGDKGKGKGDKGKGKGSGKGKDKGGKGKDSRDSKQCYLCGKPGHFAKQCPDAAKLAKLEGTICHKCDGKGHYANKCPSKISKGGKSDGKKGSGKKGKIGHELQQDTGETPDGLGSVAEPEASPSSSAGMQMAFLQMPFLMSGSEHGDVDFSQISNYLALGEQRFSTEISNGVTVASSSDSLVTPKLAQFAHFHGGSIHWLVDSGASAHVVKRSDLKFLHVLKTKEVSVRFMAAQGQEVSITEQATLKIPFVFRSPPVSSSSGSGHSRDTSSATSFVADVILDAFIGDVQSNVLSVGSLNSRGWFFESGAKHSSLYHDDGKQRSVLFLTWFANCPWVECRTSSMISDAELKLQKTSLIQPVLQQSAEDDALHVLRGHQPPDPKRCVICARAHGISFSRRKQQPQRFQLQCDFKEVSFVKGKCKFLVMAHAMTGCIGLAAVGDNSSRTVASIRDFLQFLGFVGNGPNIEILTDSELAVGKLMKQCSTDGRHLIVQRAAPQEHQTIGLAERSVRKLKESIRAIEIQLEDYGFCLNSSEQFSCQAVGNYFASCHNRFAVMESGNSPKDELFDKDMDTSQSAFFSQVVLGEVPQSLELKERFARCMYLHHQVNGQLGHSCVFMDKKDNTRKVFTAKHIKLLLPTQFDPSLCIPHVVSPIEDHPLPPVLEGEGVDAVDQEIDDQEVSDLPVVDLDGIPAAGYDGKSNPPVAFYRKHGFTKGCHACTHGVRGQKHTVACRKRYATWVNEQLSRAAAVEMPEPQREEQVEVDSVYEPSIAPRDELPPSENVADLGNSHERSEVPQKRARFRLPNKSSPGDYYMSGEDRAIRDSGVSSGSHVDQRSMDVEDTFFEPDTHSSGMDVDSATLTSLLSQMDFEPFDGMQSFLCPIFKSILFKIFFHLMKFGVRLRFVVLECINLFPKLFAQRVKSWIQL